MRYVLAFILLILAVNIANGQNQSLADQLATLDKQLAQEQAAITHLREQLNHTQSQQTDKEKALASELFELQVKQINLAKDNQRLANRLTDQKQESNELAAQRKQIELTLLQQAQQLDIDLRELPGMTSIRQQVQNTLKNKDKWTIADANLLLMSLIETQVDSSKINIKQVTLPTADGSIQNVELLSIGHAAFAYHIPASNTVAYAWAAPEDASGYRWSEDLSPDTASSLRDAFTQLGRGESLINIPLDITQRIRSENLQQAVTLQQRIQSGGLIMIPMFALTALALLMIAERCFTLYIRNGQGTQQASTIIRATIAGKLDEARDKAANANTAVARTLNACLSRHEVGSHAMEDAIQEQLLHEMPKLQRFLGGIAILAAVAPLLGLLGTVTGIIHTFGVIQSFGNANPSLMAGGISEALITTAAGLIIAIPLLLAHSLLKGRVQTILSDAEKHAATLLNTLTYAHPNTTENKP
jgi:biopolymer transport protein ExbB